MKHPLSKKMKVLRNLIFIILAAIAVYYASGCPILFPRLRMRMEEKMAMVGPSVIVDHLDGREYSEFTNLYVGETRHGIVFYTTRGWNEDRLYYRNKTGDLTLLSAPTYGENWHTRPQERTLPIYLFHEYPTAVRAEVDLTIIGDKSDPYYKWDAFSMQYHLEAVSEDDRIFRFYIHVPQVDSSGTTELGIAGMAPQLFSEICHSTNYDTGNQKAYATIRLYDADSTLLVEKALTICSITGEVSTQD